MSAREYLGALVLAAGKGVLLLPLGGGPLSALDVELGEAAMAPNPHHLLARLAVVLVTRPGTGVRAALRPLPLAGEVALSAVGPGLGLGRRMLDAVAVAGASVVATRKEASALAPAGTGLQNKK